MYIGLTGIPSTSPELLMNFLPHMSCPDSVFAYFFCFLLSFLIVLKMGLCLPYSQITR